MGKPIAVVASDIHYNIQTLKLADASMRMAIAKANELGVPLIVAGDLHDTKANLRGECVNAMLATLKLADIKPYVIVGNHDMINERGVDHALEFLNGTVNLISRPTVTNLICAGSLLRLAPYFTSLESAVSYFSGLPEGSVVIAHQGIEKSHAGEYIQDKSAISWADVSHLRVISGHYHNRQSIRTSDVGLWDYVGNPYTLTFGEAKDPVKGFQILNDDSSLTFVPTNLRKHVILELTIDDLDTVQVSDMVQPGDLVWIKLTGTKEELTQVTRKGLSEILSLSSFKLDLIPLSTDAQLEERPAKITDQRQILDGIIDQIPNASTAQKERLKAVWRTHVKTA